MNPADLISHGRGLIPTHRGAPKQVALRRAVSAAYYALFHAILRTTSDDLVGKTSQKRRSPAYRLLYRAFEHSNIRRVCIEAVKSKLSPKFAEALGTSKFPESIQVAARGFLLLQEKRHDADYDPYLRWSKSDARVALLMAEHAIGVLDGADASDRRIFLMLMLFSPR
jgi:hypothetical protein